MDGLTRRQAIVALVIGLAFVAGVSWLWSNRNRVEVLDVRLSEPGALLVNVNSCNAEPEAAIVELGEGRYQFEARTTVAWDRGDACADAVEIRVDPNLSRFEVVDKVGGDTFVVPTAPPEAPVDIDGTWSMVEVNGEPVQVGVNTAVVPRVTIRAGFLDGNFGCNFAGAELLQEGDAMRPSPGGAGDGALCDSPDEPGLMVATERTLKGLLRSGFELERADDRMTWSGAPGSVVFELVGE